MISSIQLRSVPPFSDLPDDQISWFLSCVEEVRLRPGEAFVRQGDPADWMIIFLEGLFQWMGDFGGDTVSLPAQAGEVSGVFPFSRMKRFTVTGRALTAGHLLKFPSARHSELIQKMPELTTRLVAMMSDRIREGTRIEQQRDRLISLGKLSAGLAHGLNNPASAAKRASRQMQESLAKLRRANSALWRLTLADSRKIRIEQIESLLLESAVSSLDGLALSDLEEKLEAILRYHGIADPWEFSGPLARCGLNAESLASLLINLDSDAAQSVMTRIAASAEIAVLLSTIENTTSRISGLIQAVKQYTNMDRAPVQSVDVVRNLEATLTTLNHILQPGISVQRDYQLVPLLVNAAATELNQVWTNIIENASEAMLGQGQLRLRTFREDKYVVVEFGDDGPGIPPEIEPHIFDPFFTTKGVGEGTGLGLNTAMTIVRKHGGNIQVNSKPGDTRFQVWLPWADPLELGKPNSG